MKTKILAVFPILFLAACTSTPKDVKPTEITFDDKNIINSALFSSIDRLIDSAAVSTEANLELSKIAMGDASLRMSEEDYVEYIFQKGHIPKGMEEDIDLVWSGPVFPVIQMLADLSGYEVAPPATNPISVPIIDIDTNSHTINNSFYGHGSLRVIDALRAINSANKDKLDIVIYEDLSIIEIKYL